MGEEIKKPAEAKNPTKSKIEEAERSFDSLLERTSQQRKESIRRSMSRPLGTEMVRTSYIIACVLVDILLVPGLCVSVAGRTGLVIALVLLLPLVYVEQRAHRAWFPLPSPATPESEGEKPETEERIVQE
ncbi:MAG: hypothetical protein ACUVT7_03160 [Thermoplasmata archaeon]